MVLFWVRNIFIPLYKGYYCSVSRQFANYTSRFVNFKSHFVNKLSGFRVPAQVLCVLAQCSFVRCNRWFTGTHSLHLPGRNKRVQVNTGMHFTVTFEVNFGVSLIHVPSALKVEAACSLPKRRHQLTKRHDVSNQQTTKTEQSQSYKSENSCFNIIS